MTVSAFAVGVKANPIRGEKFALSAFTRRPGSAVLACLNEGSGRVIEIALAVVHFHDGREIVVTQAQVEGQAVTYFPIVLREQSRDMLSVTQFNHG